jgi:hypothetical protein
VLVAIIRMNVAPRCNRLEKCDTAVRNGRTGLCEDVDVLVYPLLSERNVFGGY